MPKKPTNIIAGILILFMGLLAFLSILNDSLTYDETAHIAAGYSYLTQRDMRLNPEHPPLIKDMAGFPLLFLNLNFPKSNALWQNATPSRWWDQFDVASLFLYRSNNNPDQILFWSKMPMVLITLLLAYYVFRWSREIFGDKAALISLFLFSFSPTLLAHGRLVTTDVGAAAGIFIATYYFIKFLTKSSKINLLKSGIFLGLAELSKFSTILLLPFFAILVVVWALLKSPSGIGNFAKNFGRYACFFALIIVIGYAMVWGVYKFHTWNYPVEKQIFDSKSTLSSFKYNFLSDSAIWMAANPVLRPIAQYLLGLMMVAQRTSGGNTSYFMGEISAGGWRTYFPTVYLVKEPLPFHILLATALISALWFGFIKNPFWKKPKTRLIFWIRGHFPEFAMLLFIGIYWATSLSGNLNIGVRHLIPVFPFTILLVSRGTLLWLKPPRQMAKKIILGFLLIWQAYSVISIYPSFLAYFNELAGGPDNGYKIAVDSNLDWGQDLKRLAKWADERNIKKIYIDYFGGGDLNYYLDGKFSPWWGARKPNELPNGSYLAISATLLQGGRAKPAPNFTQPTDYYRWLDAYEPIAKIGYSIFVYKIDR